MDNAELRKLYNDLLDVLNKHNTSMEAKRITLALLEKQCEIEANNEIVREMSETVTEEGELGNGTELDKGAR